MAARNWCFTDHKSNPEDIEPDDNIVRYLVFQQEETKKGNPHLQGYAEFTKPVRIPGAKKALGLSGSAHLEIRHGSRDEARNYCMKEESRIDGPWEHGTWELKPGKRNDIEAIRKIVKEGGTITDVLDNASSYQSAKFGLLYIEHNEPKRNWKTHVEWIWGPTGSGKSAYAAEQMPDAWWSGRDLKWWQGYSGHANVIIDDFRGDFCKFHELLRILDRYPYTVEVKGGSRQLLAKKIIITSAFHPANVYNISTEDVEQLLRRIERLRRISMISEAASAASAPPSAAAGPASGPPTPPSDL